MLHIVIIHSYRVGVINADNKMITLARIGRIIWIYHKTVYEKTAPYLTPEEAQWLAEKTKPVL